jgi:transcriptional regulator with XRE-family HTH domain
MDLEGLTTYDVGKRCGVAQRTVVNILNGTSSPSMDTVDKIASGFGLNLWHLIMPDLAEDMSSGGSISKLYEAYQASDIEGRDLIIKMAEREATHSKNK